MGHQIRAYSKNRPAPTGSREQHGERRHREEYVAPNLDLSGGMPRHLMNHEEFTTSYPREKQMDREDLVRVITDQKLDQERGIYTRRYRKGNGILEMEALEQCLE